jgi:anaerobic glycerol-3-phosphate dehydrogenase
VDEDLRPQFDNHTPVYQNLYTVGAMLSGADSLRERSLEGVALASAFAATNHLMAKLKPDEYIHA